jgi:single-stranded DNA-binding protein
MSFVKHMRLGKDVEVKKNSNDNEFVTGSAAYDVYRGKNNRETVWINFIANGPQAEFLKKFGKKGSVLKFYGEITPGNAYKKDDKMVSTINLSIDNVKFSEISSGNQQSGAQSGTGSQTASTPSTSEESKADELKETDDIFNEFWNEENE